MIARASRAAAGGRLAPAAAARAALRPAAAARPAPARPRLGLSGAAARIRRATAPAACPAARLRPDRGWPSRCSRRWSGRRRGARPVAHPATSGPAAARPRPPLPPAPVLFDPVPPARAARGRRSPRPPRSTCPACRSAGRRCSSWASTTRACSSRPARSPSRAGSPAAPCPARSAPPSSRATSTPTQGPGIFYRLDTLRPGDLVSVGRSDGVAVRYRVTDVLSVPKDAFPTGRSTAPPPDPSCG